MTVEKKLKSNLVYEILKLMVYNYQNNSNSNSKKIINKFIFWVHNSITKKKIKYLINNHPICQKIEIISIKFNKNSIDKSLIKFNKNYFLKYKKLVLLLKLKNSHN